MDRSDVNPLSATCPVCTISWPGVRAHSDDGRLRWHIDPHCPQCKGPALVTAQWGDKSRTVDCREMRRET